MTTLDKIRDMKPIFLSLDISRVRVFGSVARGDDTDDSDIDLLVEFDKPIGLFRYASIQRSLSEALGKTVDLVTEDALHPALRQKILEEARDV